MEVYYIANAVIPSHRAHTVNIMNMCGGFAAAGYPTTLITSRRRETATEAADVWKFYGLPKQFSIKRLFIFANPKIPSLFQYRSLRHVRKDNALLMTRHLTVAARAVHQNRRTVFECHRPEYSNGHLLTELIQSDLFRLVLITGALKEHWTRRLGEDAAEKMLVAPDAVFPERYSAAQKDVRPGAPLKAGYAGSLARGKGIELIVRLAEMSKDDSMSFHVAGGEPEEVAAWRKKTEGLAGLQFHGHMPHSCIPSFLADMDILLLPNQLHVFSPESSTDIGQWTSPLKMFEYMAAGRPVIASDLPVLREVLEHGKNAWLVAAEDPGQWRQALLALGKESTLRRQLGERARSDAENNYTWTKRAQKIAGLYGA